MADTTQPTTSEEGSRAVLLGARPMETDVQRKRYAVIVGISKYKDPNLNLRYAHRDAEELDKLIRTPRSGGFPAENIKTLIDEEATTGNITKALRSFLQKPGKEDLVLVYLACHGAPDPNRPQNVYLITSDTDPLDIPGTALPMSDIQRDLERTLLAERVVLIADTCHSGAVGDSSGRRSGIFFAGNGSLSHRDEPTILPYDARDPRIPNDLLLSDLAQEAAQFPGNLVTLIDAGWAAGDELPWGAPSHSRFVTADVRPIPTTRAVSLRKQPEQKSSGLYGDVQPWQMEPELQQIRQQVGEQIAQHGLGIGRTTFYPSSFQAVFTQDGLPPGMGVAEAEFPSPLGDGPSKPRGALTFTFIQAVLKRLAEGETATGTGHMPEPITYADLCSTIASHLKWLQPFFIGVRPTECIFGNVVQEDEFQNAIRRQVIEQPLHRAAGLLERLLERRKGEDMEARLNLGVIQAARGEYAASVRSLQEAIKQEKNGAPELCHEAHYHLGRVMTITASAPTPPALSIGYGEERPGNLDTAISELRDAIRGNPDNAAAYYYLGQAIFTRVQQEQLVEVEQSWQKYLDMGATVGRKNEVRQQLAALRSSALGTGSGLAKKPWSGSGTGAG